MSVIKEKLPPSQLENDITQRCEQLGTILAEVRSRLIELKKLKPKGRIKVVSYKGQFNCIYYESPKDKKGKFIKKAQMSQAKEVSDYNYLKKLEKALSIQMRSLRKTLNVLRRKKIPLLSKGRSLLTEPVTYSNSIFADLWQHSQKKGPVRISDYVTQKGEKVCSKSELMIAGTLFKRKIPYHYERPLNTSSGTIHPDFLCLNTRTHQEFIWEHLGMMDDPAYAEKAIARIKKYRSYGYVPGKNLILTFETKTNIWVPVT